MRREKERRPAGQAAKAATIILAFMAAAWIDPYKDEVSDGNRAFHKGKYKEARDHYGRAENHVPAEKEKRKLSFNKGDADLMLENYDRALTGFNDAVQSEDRDVQKKAFYNIGNTYLRQGNYREAASAFINALKIDPGYDKAKKNLEYIIKHRKNQEQQSKNNQGRSGQKDGGAGEKKDRDRQGKGEQNPGGASRQARGEPSMSKDQIRNLLNSMKNSPVSRKKGGNEQRNLDKNW